MYENIGEVVRSIPAMIGFYPTDSLVVITVVPDDSVAAIDDLTTADGHVAVRRLLKAAPPEQPRPNLVALVVGGDHKGHRGLIDDVLEQARLSGATVCAAVWIDRIADGAQWHSYRDTGTGILRDPAESSAMADAVAAGQIIRPSRQAIRDALLPEVPEPVLARRRDLIHTIAENLDDTTAEAIVRAAITAATTGTLPETDQQIAELIAALDHPARDLPLVALLEDTEPSIGLWERVTRGIDGAHQRRPATILAIAYHLEGDGVSSYEAVDLACQWSALDEPAPMLRTAFQQGMTPPNSANWSPKPRLPSDPAPSFPRSENHDMSALTAPATPPCKTW